ncbi:MAG: 3-hydroxyacyl-CoA dehydrogenase/enoyl-CoA hydratase family protein [Pseudomonadota bacterium]
MNRFVVRQAAVLGAGVMGAQIAAHLVNADVPTLLFELPPAEGDANANVVKAIEGLATLDPAPLSTLNKLTCIRAANYAQHLELLKGCDLVIEAIAERTDWKADLYRRIAPHLGEYTVLVSNTSGLSIQSLSEALPESVQSRFCGMHFFNPPRYMHLVELIPCAKTAPGLLDQLEAFLVSTLGKGVVRAKDTPNFIANRIGVFSTLTTKHHAQAYGLAFDTVDALTGRYLGRPKSATFRTLDVVGLDVFAHVVNTMRENLSDDPWRQHYELPEWFGKLVAQGALGQKTKRGIYQKIGGEIHVLDLQSQTYRLSDGKADEGVKDILRQRDWANKLAALHGSPHPQAQFLWSVFRDVFHYCALHLEQIADSAREVDFAVRWGFGWEQGPFEIWQAAGWQQVSHWIEEDIRAGKAMANVPLPPWVTEPMRRGVHEAAGSFSPVSGVLKARPVLPVYARQLFPERLLGEVEPYSETVFETDAVRVWHTGDDIAVLSFKTKLHTIGNDVLDDVLRAVDTAEAHFAALLIWQTEPPFSVGANLLQLMQGVQESPEESQGVFDKLKGAAQRVKYTVAGGGGLGEILNAATGNVLRVEEVVAKFQRTTQRLKYARVPTIAVIDGLALGGGCEFALHCSRIVASLESYIGLVEVGVGLLPAGGGCKEMALRAAQEAQGGELFPILRRAFQNIALGTVAKSAELGREMGYLRHGDRIVMNRFELLHVAKQEVRSLTATDYRPPLPPPSFAVAGRAGIANFKAAMVNMLEGGFISEHDFAVGSRVAEVICGGEVEAGSLVDEQWLLDLERRHFMALLATEKTQARIEHMLKTGKPLRN